MFVEPNIDPYWGRRWRERRAVPDENPPYPTTPTFQPIVPTNPPPPENITVIVIAEDGQRYAYNGPESGLKRWFNKLVRQGVRVGKKGGAK